MSSAMLVDEESVHRSGLEFYVIIPLGYTGFPGPCLQSDFVFWQEMEDRRELLPRNSPFVGSLRHAPQAAAHKTLESKPKRSPDKSFALFKSYRKFQYESMATPLASHNTKLLQYECACFGLSAD